MKPWVMEQAIKTAKKSNYPHFRHGAVIECGGRILSKNPNIRKSQTPDASMSVHAEVAALKPLLSKTRLRWHIPPVVMYVARVNPNNEVVLSKPCDRCLEVLRKSCIVKTIYYSTNNGWDKIEIY